MRPATTLFVALAFVPIFAEAAAVQRARYLMGTVCEVAVTAGTDPAEIEKAFAEASRIESMLSTWTDDSELARVNRGAAPSDELRALLGAAMGWMRRTDGAFDPRIGMLIDVWKTRGKGSLAKRADLDLALADRDAPAPQYEEGGFGKGYALDRMLSFISAPEAMIDFGGQIAVRGEVRVRIADPADRQRPVLELTLRDGSISTSSGSEKTFEAAGRRFSHIIDPRNGEALPPRGSVSVIAREALTADILSTALYVMGEEEGLRWSDANGVAAIFIDPDNTIRTSAKAREHVRGAQLLDPKFTIRD